MNHEHQLDVVCIKCVINEIEQDENNHLKYEKLLSFVKKIRDGYTLSQTTIEALEMFVGYEYEADSLLKEIGYKND